jgi:hypothetical protein
MNTTDEFRVVCNNKSIPKVAAGHMASDAPDDARLRRDVALFYLVIYC